jgi:Domain of unknown function (DUF4232)
MKFRTLPAVSLALCVFGLAACGSGNSTSSASSSSGSSTPTPSSSGTLAPPVSATSTSCTLTASVTHGSSYAGHSVDIIVLTNTGAASCALNGYPTVSLQGGGGALSGFTQGNGDGQAATATPSAVDVAPGHTAQFVLELADIGSGGAPCPSATSAVVELPSSAGSVTVDFSPAIQPCPPEQHVGALTAG